MLSLNRVHKLLCLCVIVIRIGINNRIFKAFIHYCSFVLETACAEMSQNAATPSVRAVDSQTESISERVPEGGVQLVWYYTCLIIRKIVGVFKAIAQVLTILYQFLTYLYQCKCREVNLFVCLDPNCVGYAVDIAYNSLLTCYYTGIVLISSQDCHDLVVSCSRCDNSIRVNLVSGNQDSFVRHMGPLEACQSQSCRCRIEQG